MKMRLRIKLGFLLQLSNPTNFTGAILFISGNSTAIIFLSGFYYVFDSHSRDERGIPSAHGFSIVMKFRSLSQIEKYIKYIYLQSQNHTRLWFQLQLIQIEIRKVVWEKKASCDDIKDGEGRHVLLKMCFIYHLY